MGNPEDSERFVSEEEFFWGLDEAQRKDAPKKEQATVGFKQAIDQLLEGNSAARFVAFRRGKDVEAEKEVIRQQLDRDGIFDDPETLGEELSRLQGETSEPGIYEEHMYLSHPCGDVYFMIGKVISGAEVLNPIPAADSAAAEPSFDVETGWWCTRYSATDEENRSVPSERQEKEFYEVTDSGLVLYRRHPILPNWEDFGASEPAQRAYDRALAEALYAECREPTEEASSSIRYIIRELSESEPQTLSHGRPPTSLM